MKKKFKISRNALKSGNFVSAKVTLIGDIPNKRDVAKIAEVLKKIKLSA